MLLSVYGYLTLALSGLCVAAYDSYRPRPYSRYGTQPKRYYDDNDNREYRPTKRRSYGKSYTDDYDYAPRGRTQHYGRSGRPSGYKRQYPDGGYDYEYKTREAPKETYTQERYPSGDKKRQGYKTVVTTHYYPEDEDYHGKRSGYRPSKYDNHRRYHKSDRYPSKYDHRYEDRYPKRSSYTPYVAEKKKPYYEPHQAKYQPAEIEKAPVKEERSDIPVEKEEKEEKPAPEVKEIEKPKPQPKLKEEPCDGTVVFCDCMKNIQSAGMSKDEKSDACNMYMDWGNGMSNGDSSVMDKSMDQSFSKLGSGSKYKNGFFEKKFDW